MRTRNIREPLSYTQHHGRQPGRQFHRSNGHMQATFRPEGMAKGSSMARAGLQLVTNPKNPTVAVARGAGLSRTRDPDHFKSSYSINFGPQDARPDPRPPAEEDASGAAAEAEAEREAARRRAQRPFSTFGAAERPGFYSLRQQGKDREELKVRGGVRVTGTAVAWASQRR